MKSCLSSPVHSKALFLLIALFLSAFCHKAFAISVSDFLATAKDDPLVQHQKDKIDFLHSTSSNTPYFDKVEIRTQTGEFEIERQEYSVRMYPKGFGSTKAGKKVYDATVRSNETQQELVLHQALKERYLIVIALLHSQNLLTITEQLLEVFREKSTVLNKMRNTLDFDINDLVKAEIGQTDRQLELIGLENTLHGIKNQIRIYSGEDGPVTIDTSTLAEIEVVIKTIEQTNTAPTLDNIHLKDSAFRMELAKGMYELEKAEGRRYISFLEASYDTEERHNAAKVFSCGFGLGIRLPFIKPNRLDSNRRKLQFLEKKSLFAEQEKTLAENMNTISNTLKRLLKQYEILNEKTGQGTAKTTLKRYMQLQGVDPLVLLEMKESILRQEMTFENICYEIYTQYIELLDLTGKLSNRPIINYISKEMGPLGT